MLSGRERTVWIRVANGVETLSGIGPRVWNEPAAVRIALREMLPVLPITHAQIDLAALRGRAEPASPWKDLLSRSGDWTDLLREMVAAITDAVRGRAEWGIGLPSPAIVADSLGDASERGTLKAGIQLASFLQGFREAGLAFVTLDLSGPSVAEKAVAQVMRNAQMYGWRQAAAVDSMATPVAAEIRLASAASIEELTGRWQQGELRS